ncbi:hypothetical protein [Actinomycetospora cinnamomea]|uniref:hypothetical protein n=1 Tax=Actinomycetospora cinnamomea TaxID=663609 RepID=UPI001057D093|nr:hypothetical protein [Actinomycetospora cinnamomea]
MATNISSGDGQDEPAPEIEKSGGRTDEPMTSGDYSKALEFEHDLINRKITWLLTSQTILFAALGLTLQALVLRMVDIIAYVGLALCSIGLLGLVGNFRAKRFVHSDYKASRILGSTGERLRGREPGERICWIKRCIRWICGRREPDRAEWGVRSVTTWWGVLMDCLIPVAFGVAWIFVLIHSGEIVEAAKAAKTVSPR